MKLLSFFTFSEYTVGYRFSEKDIIEDTSIPYKVISLKKDEWYADPFIIFHDGEYYVFMEIMMKEKGYAGIGCSKLVNGVLTDPEIVIDYGKHLSFPFIFEHNGEIYIMPESCSEKKIKLMRCVEFPDKWEECYCIDDARTFYDSVIFENDGKRFLFTSQPTSDLYGSKLYLMEIDEDSTGCPKIISEKIVSNNYTNSREAGRMINKNGKLIRVAQDCSRNEYGRALEFLEVENLENYSEHSIKHIEPKNVKTEKRILGKSGIHTYNRVDNFEVIDLKISVFSIKATFLKIKIIFGMLKEKLLHRQ